MGTYKPLDYFSWAPHLDVISWDSYPQRNDHPSVVAFKHDLMRGLKAGQSWLLMEQTPSQVQWAPHNPLKRPGVMRLISYQAVARGSDAVMYFQWRQSRGSAEKYHGAIVSHAGHEHTGVFSEVAALGAELKSLGDGILGTRLPARVALVFSWPNWWNVEYTPGPSSSLRYVDEVLRYYRPLWERNIAVDVISPDRDLSGYDLVIAPLLNMVSAEQGAAIERYVQNGGTFVTTYFSGVVDESDRAWLGGYPGPLRRPLGIWVEEFDPLEPDMTNQVVVQEGGKVPAGTYTCDLWCDLVRLEGAHALATYGEDFYAGMPAITEHSFGKGRALYVATRPEPALLAALLGVLLDDLRIAAPLQAPAGVEVTRREGDGRSYSFVLNHNTFPVRVSLPMAMRNLLTGETYENSIALQSKGVAILT
jgi:beta-galactosidase